MDGYNFAEDYPMAPLEDDCRLLKSLLDDCLRIETGEEFFNKVERIRELAGCAAQMNSSHDPEASRYLSKKMQDELRQMPLEEALPMARAFGHYLNLTGIAETHHTVRQLRESGSSDASYHAVFGRLLAKGITPDELYDAVSTQHVEIVLTAHPTQVNRRTLQYKHTALAHHLNQNDRADLTPEEKEHIIEELVREVTAIWQTDELRRRKPTPVDEARGGLHIVEQSLWAAVPQYLRKLSAALKAHTGRELPLSATPMTFGTWMGGDRDGNPNVTSKVTHDVACLGRWIAADLYLREVDALRFELSMSECSEEVRNMATEVLMKRSEKAARSASGYTESADDFVKSRMVPAPASRAMSSAIAAGQQHPDAGQSANKFKQQLMHAAASKGKGKGGVDAMLNPHGYTPYRIVLGEVRQKLLNTRKRMEDVIGGNKPNNEVEWFEDAEDLAAPLLACYWSLWECGGGIIAEGRLQDLLRRIYCFGLCLMKMDIRQEAPRHAEAMNAITEYLDMGSYNEWDEEKKIAFLEEELAGKRPLIPPNMEMSDDVKEVLETFRVAAMLGSRSLGAYVISMAQNTSDVLAVELLQREARLMVAAEQGTEPDHMQSLRVAPLFETLDDLEAAGKVMDRLLRVPIYRKQLEMVHGNHQEIMLGYSDSGKDAGRLAANWALYQCQEQIVAVCNAHSVKTTLFHGRGGTVGRGGGPLHLAMQSQPAGSVKGTLRVTEQGEMIQAKFGLVSVAAYQLEQYTHSVLNATLDPPAPPASEKWVELIGKLAEISCNAYRGVVFKNPYFIKYFRDATPEEELGNLNIGSRPSRRKKGGGVETLRAIPWIFAWTQTRMVLPAWLGIGEAFQWAIGNGYGKTLREMYEKWPFFQSTIDLIEMILAKADMRIAKVYDEVLVHGDEYKDLGEDLREKLQTTMNTVLHVSSHHRLCDNNPKLRRLIEMRNPFIDPINILQVEILRRLRAEPENSGLRDALMVTINGISAGMRNTG